jgi:hypothetical protein
MYTFNHRKRTNRDMRESSPKARENAKLQSMREEIKDVLVNGPYIVQDDHNGYTFETFVIWD